MKTMKNEVVEAYQKAVMEKDQQQQQAASSSNTLILIT